MEDEIIEKILGIDIKVLTNTGEEKVLSISDLVNIDENKTKFSVCADEVNDPYYKIDLHIECDGYGWRIQPIKEK